MTKSTDRLAPGWSGLLLLLLLRLVGHIYILIMACMQSMPLCSVYLDLPHELSNGAAGVNSGDIPCHTLIGGGLLWTTAEVNRKIQMTSRLFQPILISV